MIKSVRFQNWKSFRDATLHIDPLTVLIGANASGKSNVLDGLEFLRRIANGKELQTALAGDAVTPPIRGGVEWAAFRGERHFVINAVAQEASSDDEYHFNVDIGLRSRRQIRKESLIKWKKDELPDILYVTENMRADPWCAVVKLGGNVVRDKYTTSKRELSLFQLKNYRGDRGVVDGISVLTKALSNIFAMNPFTNSMRRHSDSMRNYSELSDILYQDATNIAGFLAALDKEAAERIQRAFANYASHLPERDIVRVWAEKAGRFRSDAMLYCEEGWSADGKPIVVDSRGMSDGTLRFIAIVTALLTRPRGSLLAIEEVDTGLHPSRAGLLLRMLRELGAEAGVDVLVTTHNPALLDAMTPDFVPFVTVAHRDDKTGESHLTLLEDIKDLPRLLASGPLGHAATTGAIERSLKAR